MNNLSKAFALLSLTAIAGTAPGIASAQTTQKLSASKANDFGLVYNLPTTVLDVTIEAEHTVRTPGEFYSYAKKYLNIDNPITEPSQSWTVKSVNVNSRGVADPKEQYLIQFKPGQTPYIVTDENSMPLAINTENTVQAETPELPQPQKAAPTPLQTEAARQVVTEDMLRSQSMAKRAELAAQRIYELRQSRNDLITGQADQMPPDGKAMQIIIDQIAAQEAALTAMFVGTTQTSTDVATFTFIPSSEDDRQNKVLARISATDGIVGADDLSGDPVTLQLRVKERGRLPLNEKGETREMPKGGVAYRIPGTAQISIDFDGRTMWEGTVDAAQYGIVYGIDPKVFADKKSPAYAIFDPVTGALRELGSRAE